MRLANAAGGGWSLVSTVNANSGFSPDASFSVNAGLVSSSYWLITAFNSSFGGSVGNYIGDAIKVMGVTAGTSSTVTPAASSARRRSGSAPSRVPSQVGTRPAVATSRQVRRMRRWLSATIRTGETGL